MLFDAVDDNKRVIYHTNVMLSICENTVVICAESISDKKQRDKVLQSLRETKRDIIEISFLQMKQFCANILEISNTENTNYIIMSEAAEKAFTENQKNILKLNSQLISSPLQIIEYIGGGSARCMIAEIF